MMSHAGVKRKSMFTQRRECFSPRGDNPHMPWAKVGAWFVGPKAENAKIYNELVLKAVNTHLEFRRNYFPSDPEYITDELKESPAYKEEIRNLEDELETMREEMKKSVPYFSPRYKGHVIWDPNMVAQLGNLTAFMYNQNNAIEEAGTVTTRYEVEAGKDLCEMVGFHREDGRGHLTAGGTVANCEAMWCARNVKFLPLALKDSVNNEKQLAPAKTMSITLPGGESVLLVNASLWQLLNLNTDVICGMPDKIAAEINTKKAATDAEMTYLTVMTLTKKYQFEAMGALKFYAKHGITADKAPVCVAPTTSHISLFKGVNMAGLGLGDDSMILIACDENSRVITDDLEKKLDDLRKKQIPVVVVIAVMGTTEESAIDNVDEILKIRDKMRKKSPPLDFMVHCDAAWGGYFCTMIRDPPEHQRKAVSDEGFVPELALSHFVQRQLHKMAEVDTVTLDPHKSGFCTYPAGAIAYRNSKINEVLNVMVESDTPYYYGNVNLGNWGIEGSKPGTAAAAAYLSNRVIGLHKNGHGRILAECTFTSKLMYCLWTTLAQENDPFIVVTTKPLKSSIVQDPISFIRNNIMGKSNEEIAQDKKAMAFLQEIGPDTLMPNFAVNFKDASGNINKDIDPCNALNDAVFKLNVHATDAISARRWPMLVTASYFAHHQGSHALPNLKERLGLSDGPEEKKKSLRYIICCSLDPFATSMDYIDHFGNIIRNAILSSIGTISDKPGLHNFVTTGEADQNLHMIVYYAGGMEPTSQRYTILAKFRLSYDDDARDILRRSAGKTEPVVFRTTAALTLHDLLLKNFEEGGNGLTFEVDCYHGVPTAKSQPFKKGVPVKVVDGARYNRFDLSTNEIFDSSQFFLYGDCSGKAYMGNVPVKGDRLDFYQLVELSSVPSQLDDALILSGVEMTLSEAVPAYEEKAQDALVRGPVEQGKEYMASFVGHKGIEYNSTIKIWKNIWQQTGLFSG